MSKDYETFIVAQASPNLVLGQKHRATDLVQMLVGKVRRTKRSLRCFLKKECNITKKLNIPRISDTRFVTHFICIISLICNQMKRFAWRDIASLYVWTHLYSLLLFVVQHTILTKNELQRIFWILHPELRCIIAARAVFAHAFLLPAMKKANKIVKKLKTATGIQGNCFTLSFFFLHCDLFLENAKSLSQEFFLSYLLHSDYPSLLFGTLLILCFVSIRRFPNSDIIVSSVIVVLMII